MVGHGCVTDHFLYICNSMDLSLKETLIGWAHEYNDPKYFQEDPIIFPTHFARLYRSGEASLADIEISALLAAHLAWGRRAMIVRDCGRMLDEMDWRPYEYVMNGEFRNEDISLHRTIKWSDFAAICTRMKAIYERQDSIEGLTDAQIRVEISGQKEDRKAPNKKISMMRRWMVRDDGKVDLGVWKNSDKRSLILPLDVHVHEQATILGLTGRRQKDIVTAQEITDAFREIWPDDPCLGDFALFGYGVTHK